MMINTYVNVFVRRFSPNRIRKGGTTPFFYVINTYMKDKKAAKLILKRAKKNPSLYTEEEVTYAKKIKKDLKKDALSH